MIVFAAAERRISSLNEKEKYDPRPECKFVEGIGWTGQYILNPKYQSSSTHPDAGWFDEYTYVSAKEMKAAWRQKNSEGPLDATVQTERKRP